MGDIITLDEIKGEYQRILKLYGNGDAPGGIEWYKGTMENIEGLFDLYGRGCHVTLDYIRPNTFASQSSVSQRKYDLYMDKLGSVGWEIFPVPVGHFPDARTCAEDLLAYDGHTRLKVFLNEGKRLIKALTFEGRNGNNVARLSAQGSQPWLNSARPRRISELPITADWDFVGLNGIKNDYGTTGLDAISSE